MENKVEASKARLVEAFKKLENVISEKINTPSDSKVMAAENYRLEKHIQTLTSRYNLLQKAAVDSINECENMLDNIDKLVKK